MDHVYHANSHLYPRDWKQWKQNKHSTVHFCTLHEFLQMRENPRSSQKTAGNIVQNERISLFEYTTFWRNSSRFNFHPMEPRFTSENSMISRVWMAVVERTEIERSSVSETSSWSVEFRSVKSCVIASRINRGSLVFPFPRSGHFYFKDEQRGFERLEGNGARAAGIAEAEWQRGETICNKIRPVDVQCAPHRTHS